MRERVNQDMQWIEEFQRGNESSLAYFFKEHHRSLCYFASKIVKDERQAEDIVADCFIKLWDRRETFENTDKIKAFLYIACRNNCLNYLRNEKRKTAAQELYLRQMDQHNDEIFYEIIDTEIVDILAREIESLPDKCREVFKLIYLGGKNTEEIAQELNLNVQTVRNHKSRAIELLKTQFLKKGLSATLQLFLLMFMGRHL
ncbi:RNA polymerase sigma factor [Pedobacter psychroterrae]|uniref:RNA polymerase sigma-70 factor n=1 Tax=Pedobacter psychroterrae TaxID=2530453 RepID=A0A4R0NLH3_9SPHI|nr:RNA polymerase sigma-70 factor [Pedobacter psychroterrae]TCD01660.1 RNA polymerase sigma-70 factor [Pedobacter psychroterrae]